MSLQGTREGRTAVFECAGLSAPQGGRLPVPAPAVELDIVQLTEPEWSKVRNERSMPLDHVQIIRLGDVGQVWEFVLPI